VLLIRKFREAFKISFSVGAVVSRVVLFTGESRDRLFLLRKKKDKNVFCCYNGCVSARDCLLY